MSNHQDFMSTMGTILNIANTLVPPGQGANDTPYDLLENDKEIRIYVEAPGVASNSLEIDFFNDQLKIKGKKEPYTLNENEAEFQFHKRKLKFQDIDLSIRMPLAVTNRANVKVNLTRGILCISVNREAEAENSFRVSIGDS